MNGSLRRIVVEETHKGAIAHKGYDAISFILTHFESTNQSHNQEDGNAKVGVEMTLK